VQIMSLSKSLGVCIGVLSLALAGCRQQLSTANPSSSQQIEIHYAPTENLEAFDNHLLRSARDSIDICAFAFTDHELAGALTAVAGKGVKVRLYLDRGQANGEMAREERGDRRSSAIGTENDSITEDSVGVLQQLAMTPNIEVRIKHSRTLMHLKSYLIDRAELRSGSANFSPTGEKRQDNDLFVTRDRASVRRFQQNFEAMWSRPDNETMPGAARR
jgi:phosphatidylserine/phosphatidylglycerophosphate/cardiolipin synthase-like enzyme